MGSDLTSLNGNITLTNGGLTLGGNISMGGDLTSTDGEVNLTNGDLVLQNGECLINNGDLTVTNGNTSLDTANVLDTLKIKGNPTLWQDNSVIPNTTCSIDPATGDIDCNDISMVGNLTSTNGNITLTNGNITLTGGTLFGNVDGTITEELVDCQRLNIRNGGVAGSTNIHLNSGSFIYNNKASTTQELLLDADTGNITGNQLTTKGNTQLGYNASTTTTIGRFGISNQSLVCECQNIDLGSSSGVQSGNVLNYRGGTHTFTGEKVIFGQFLGYSLLSCNIEGRNHKYQDEYSNKQKFFHLDGDMNTHTLKGTTQEYGILRASAVRSITITHTSGFNNSSTNYTQITNYNLTSRARSTTCRIHFEHFVQNTTGSPDCYVRIDSSSSGANAYASQIGGPLLVIYTGSMGVNNYLRVKYSITISGLFPETTYNFYPKYAKKNTSSNGLRFNYGGETGDAFIGIEWLDGETDKGSISDPYAPSDDGDDY